jgi:hypothetical protein
MFKPKGVMFLTLVILLMTYSCAKPDASGLLVFKNVRVFAKDRPCSLA